MKTLYVNNRIIDFLQIADLPQLHASQKQLIWMNEWMI